MMRSRTAPQKAARPPRHLRRRLSPGFADGLFLAAVVALSAILYVGRLGFYSDDWGFLGILSTTEDQSLIGLIRGQFEVDLGGLTMRPTQVLLQAALYRLFGLQPLGYHLVNVAVLVAVSILLYVVLRKLRLPRVLAVAVPAVYALMPNHATNRFWFASFGYMLGMAFYLLGLYGDLRAASSHRPGRVWTWKALALAALAFAAFGYEVVLPLFLLNIVLAEVVARRLDPGGLRVRLGRLGAGALHGSTVALAAVAIAYKTSVPLGLGVEGSPVRHVVRLATAAVFPNFGTYGVGLPHTVRWSLPHAGIAGVAIALLVAIGTYWYLGVTRDRAEDHGASSRATWVRLAVAGLAVFILGYAVFLTTGRIGFSSTGILNRKAAAATLGSSIVLIAMLGWAATWVRSPVRRGRLFRAGIAALCASGVIVINGLGSFWIQSWQVQRDVLADLHAAVPAPPPGSTVLLDGVCRYIGPAIVFETNWDLRGALHVQHRDRSLKADVTGSIVSIEPRGVVTRVYEFVMVYPYGDRFYLFDRAAGTAVALTDQALARRLLSEPATGRDCPHGRPGAGAVLLPFDSLAYWIQHRLGDADG